MENVELINLPKILDPRGNLSFLESNNQIPFKIKRTYWIYDVPGGETRGGHAFKEQKEVIIVLSGSLDVVIFDGVKEEKISLNRSYHALYISNNLWRHMENFSTNAVVMIVSNTLFDENDYIRDIEKFKTLKNEK
jgi:dTDP-4-dehydrorhamnose 3,5-epimerase-like enzyme